MCDYCSCREPYLIGHLGGDHTQLLAWAVRIEAALLAADHDRARAGLEQLLAILDPHLDLERALVPALSADAAFAVTATRLAEGHRRARVDRPAPYMSAPAWAAATRAYLADLRTQIHLEEYDVFPAATQLLSQAKAPGSCRGPLRTTRGFGQACIALSRAAQQVEVIMRVTS
jgi:hypothetical protein